MSGPFSEQGKFAASREPFAEWCEKQGIDFSMHAAVDSKKLIQQQLWNVVISSTRDGEQVAAETATAELRSIESDQRL